MAALRGRQAALLLLLLVQSQSLQFRPPRTTAKRLLARASPLASLPVPDSDWIDESGGRGECCVRFLRKADGPRQRVPDGALCTVLWTAWLAERSGRWWVRGDRVGNLRPDAELEFTLGGGMGEATVSWDLAVARMAPGDRVEIVAAAAYAFGPGAEPHVPADARLVFELELVAVRDWASEVQVFGADKVDDDENDAVLQRELRLATEDGGDGADGLLDDLKVSRDDLDFGDDDDDDADDAAGASSAAPTAGDDAPADPDAAPDGGTFFPSGGLDGTTAEGVSWRETRERLDLDVALPAPAASARDVTVSIGARRFDAFLGGVLVVGGDLEGPVDPDGCTWALAEDRTALEVVLSKRPARDGTPPTWARLFKRDDGAGS